MDSVAKISKEIAGILNATDKQIIQKQVKWGLSKYDAMVFASATNPIPLDATMEQFREIQGRIVETAGGQRWYDVFLGKERSEVPKIIRELYKETTAKRNETIAKKLSDGGIWVIHGSNIEPTETGFKGFLSAEGDKGVKIIFIESKGVDNTPDKIAHQKITIKLD